MSTDKSPLLPFPAGCRVGRFIRREKRFSMAVELTDKQGDKEGKKQEIWAHTNNTGSMLGLLRAGAPVLLSPAANPARKLAWTVEALGLPCSTNDAERDASVADAFFLQPDQDMGPHFWVGVNTSVPNRFLEAAFRAGKLPWAKGYSHIKREAVNGESRLDGLCTGEGLPPLWIECKNVTLVEDEVAAFPDAVTERGAKHLGTLERLVAEGQRAAMLYLIQRPDGRCFGPADYIDPNYALALKKARQNGVEIYPIVARVGMDGVSFAGEMDIMPEAT